MKVVKISLSALRKQVLEHQRQVMDMVEKHCSGEKASKAKDDLSFMIQKMDSQTEVFVRIGRPDLACCSMLVVVDELEELLDDMKELATLFNEAQELPN